MRKGRIQGIYLAPQKVRARLEQLLDINLPYEEIVEDLEKTCGYKFSIRGCCAYRQRREKQKLDAALNPPVPAPATANTITIEIIAPANVSVRIVTREATV
jgi:hypothetical protein